MLSDLRPIHRRRLRDVWRSAGWPCQDMIEVELLATGLLQRVRNDTGHETLRVTDAGIAVLADTLERNRRARSAHEALVQHVAREMARAGRIAWCGLSLRARVGEGDDARWAMAMPDVFSIRHTSVEAYLHPVVHEIKVRRADLLSDLRNDGKRAAYLQLSSECWYVLAQGIAQPQEIPLPCGVMLATGGGAVPFRLDVARPAMARALSPPFALWMALARATPMAAAPEEDQGMLGETVPGQHAADPG